MNLEAGPKANIVSLGAALAACEQSGRGSKVLRPLCLGPRCFLPAILPADSQAVGGMDIRHLVHLDAVNEQYLIVSRMVIEDG